MKKRDLEPPDFLNSYEKISGEFSCSFRRPKPLELKKYLKTINWEEIEVKDFRSFWKKAGEKTYLDFPILSSLVPDEILELLLFTEEKSWEELRNEIFAVTLDDYEKYLTSEIPELRLIAKAAGELRKGK